MPGPFLLVSLQEPVLAVGSLKAVCDVEGFLIGPLRPPDLTHHCLATITRQRTTVEARLQNCLYYLQRFYCIGHGRKQWGKKYRSFIVVCDYFIKVLICQCGNLKMTMTKVLYFCK